MSLCLLAYPCQGGGLEICLYVTNWYRIQLSKKYDECNTVMCLFFVTFQKQWCCKHNCKGWIFRGPDLCRWDWVIVSPDYVPIDCGHILCWNWNMATLDLKHRSTNELTGCKQVTSLRIKKSPKGAILLIFQTATMISSIFTQLLSSTFRVTSIQCSKHHWFGRKKKIFYCQADR